MFQLHLPRPFSPPLRHTCSLMKVMALQGAPTSFHKWDSKQLIAQGLPENIPYSALPVAKLCPHSLCSLSTESQDSKNNSSRQTSQYSAVQVHLNLDSSGEAALSAPLPRF